MELEVRLAGAGDLDSLVRLALAFRDHLEQATPSEGEFRTWFAALLQDPATDFLVACDGSGGPLAYAQIRYRHSAWVAGLQAELEDVFVGAEVRGRGIGRQLVELAVARAAARGCRSVGLTTNERNQAALALYGRLGFTAKRARWQGGRQLWLERPLDAT
jgi:ribosomal protein S18 acetylase RimI-like enzyme